MIFNIPESGRKPRSSLGKHVSGDNNPCITSPNPERGIAMPERSVRVLHVVVTRRIRATTEVLLHRHPRWHHPSSGRPMLALPATKFAPHTDASDDNVNQRLASVLHADMDLTNVALPAWQHLGETHTRLVSPTHGVPSHYRIASVLTRLPATSHGRVVRRLSGEWLSPRSALGRDDLSPTVRAVLEQQLAADWLRPVAPPEFLFGSAGERALTARLMAARDGDLEQFGLLIEEIRPVLARRLRACSSTRALAGRSHDVDDVCADAALRALEHLEAFDPTRGSVLMWLWIIARNTAVSRLRQIGRTRELSPEAETAIASGERDPAGLLAARDGVARAHARLAAALKKATPMMRRAWAMRMDEIPYHEIAGILDVPVGTIATWIGRIRQQTFDGRGDIS
jgi:RNA polymerase sigma-70 factor (ECF subfamily)